MIILKSEHNSHHFLVFLLLAWNRKMFIWIASSDYDTISIYIDLFQTIKCCFQVHVQTISLFKKIRIGMFKKEGIFLFLLGYGYIRNNLARLGGYPTHWYVADISNLFYFLFVFIWLLGVMYLPRSCLSKRNGMNKNRYKHFRWPGETVIRIHMYQFKLKKSLTCFYRVVINMCLVWRYGEDFI